MECAVLFAQGTAQPHAVTPCRKWLNARCQCTYTLTSLSFICSIFATCTTTVSGFAASAASINPHPYHPGPFKVARQLIKVLGLTASAIT